MKIKPCPFCGADAHSFQRRKDGVYPDKFRDALQYGKVWDVMCERRDCYLPDGADWCFDTEQEAIEKWNDRK